MDKFPFAQKLFYLHLAVILLQSCSNGKNAASADINKFTPDIGEFTDSRDGKIYKTTKIGEQIWMAENLNYNTNESMCYDNKVKNCDKYGKLYNWKTAMKACPVGWHLPRNEEWNILINYVGNTDKLKKISSWNPAKTWFSYIKESEVLIPFFLISFLGPPNSSIEEYLVIHGFILALYGMSYFMYNSIYPYINSRNAKFNGIDNNYGFSALPGGYVDVESNTKKSVEIKKYGGWWTATEVDSSYAYYRSLYYNMYNVREGNYYKSFLFSVRCVLD